MAIVTELIHAILLNKTEKIIIDLVCQASHLHNMREKLLKN